MALISFEWSSYSNLDARENKRCENQKTKKKTLKSYNIKQRTLKSYKT